MVRVNGKASAAVVTNMYPDAWIERNVLHLHIDVPNSESALWETGDYLAIEADWRQELGGVMYASQQGLADILARCSVQGQFHADVEKPLAGDRMLVNLDSIGPLRPLDPCPSSTTLTE
jgi:hypothetical protein